MNFQRTYRVLSGQVDISNHLSNVQYHEFYKSTIFALLFEKNYAELVLPEKMMPVVLNEFTEYFKEVGFDQEVRVEVSLAEISEKKNKMTILGKMYNSTNELISAWKCFVANMNLETRKIEPFPEKALAMFMEYEDT
jgi:acyl-CoA thioesterase FadM